MTDCQSMIYQVPVNAYALIYLRRLATVPALVSTALLAVAFIAGFSDIRWWFVALIAIFTVIPMVISMAWFSITGRRDMVIRLRPQSLRADKSSLAIDFYPFDYDIKNPQPIQSVLFTADDVADITYGKKYVRLRPVDKTIFDFVLIPVEEYPSYPIFEK